MLAAATSLGVTAFCYRWRLAEAAKRIDAGGMGYVAALLIGAAAGGFGLGSLNMVLSGTPMIARSIVGALAGAILAIELFKRPARHQGLNRADLRARLCHHGVRRAVGLLSLRP